MSDSVVKLEVEGKTHEFPVVTGAENEKAIDISTLRAQTGYITLDNGFMNTGSCRSEVTYLNGEQGVLRYRGYPIEQLAEKSNFTEVAWLLNYKDLPSKSQLENFEKEVAQFSALPEGMTRLLDQFPKEAHPMAVISASLTALSAFYPEFLDSNPSAELRHRALAQGMGQLKMMMAHFYRRTHGLDPVKSNRDLSYAADFLHLMFSKKGTEIDADVAKALDVLLILHADHEQNCSTSTVRVVGSGQANVFASLSAGVNALWGPLHGGANQAVLEMLEEIQNNGGDYKKFIGKAKDKQDPFRLMGFGHRVYKNFDPRAKIIKKACDTVLDKLGIQDPLLDIAKGLEEEALKDPYFVERNLYPNVDFYSGVIYKALGIPTNMFTPMFALGRLPGWMGQWQELRTTPGMKISRPRQIYTGESERKYTDISGR